MRQVVSQRLERWIRDTYPGISADAVIRQLVELGSEPDAFGHQLGERVLAGVAVMGQGDIERFRQAVDLVRLDWRDVLVAAGLADASWRQDLDRMLGPP